MTSLGLCPGRVAPFKAAPARLVARRGRCVVVNQQSGKVWGAEEENAAQVRRLINRDRKEFLGNDQDILDKYNVEFSDGIKAPAAIPSTSAPDGPSASAVNPFGTGLSSNPLNPFGSAPPSAPLGNAKAGSNPFKASIEPVGLRPDMSPDPFVKETPVAFVKSITLTQVVLFLSFTTIILSMVATFNFVLSTGAIRLAGLD